MRSPAHTLAFLIGIGFVWGVLHLFGLKFTEGDVYPEYSSLRSDPSGVKLLYDSLARIPELTASRNYQPLDSLEATGTTLILLGLQPSALAEHSVTLQRFATRGNRVVAAMAAAAMAGQPGVNPDAIEPSWQVRLDTDPDRRSAHRLWFTQVPGWRVLERVGVKTLAIERDFGGGTVVLLAESDDFTNQSTLAADRLDPLIAILGDNRHLIFDENHLGLAQSGSVVSMARQFRLTGLAWGLAAVVALWIWRASSAFPPPLPAQPSGKLAGRTLHSGLLTLLRRNISHRDLLKACWEQWHSANRNTLSPEKMERAANLADQAGETPLQTARAIHQIIHAKGPL